MWLVNYKIMWLDFYMAKKLNVNQASPKTKYCYSYSDMVILQLVIYKRFNKVNKGCFCNLAVQIQLVFYKRNFEYIHVEQFEDYSALSICILFAQS